MSGFASTSLNLRVMGFCGCDDSVKPELLQILSIHYSWIEWGILFRPDLEGTPRYASAGWVQHLIEINRETGGLMRLAGHLCGSRCQEILDGNHAFVADLNSQGFGRVQINATAANNVVVDISRAEWYAQNIRTCIMAVPEVEWIFQYNTETSQIWEHLSLHPPPNMSVLFDASCGKGVAMTLDSLPQPPSNPSIPCGYAGGIGPSNTTAVLTAITHATNGTSVWIDMESSLRSKITDNVHIDRDVFSVDKCFDCIQIGISFGLPVSRFTLLSI